MMQNMWSTFSKPILALAPMEDVTDTVFRQMVALCAKPDVMFTEFVNVDGLISDGRDTLLPKLRFDESERPIVSQIWGLEPENFARAAGEIKDMGFDGIDINMGCPQKDVIKHGACAGLIKRPDLAKKIVSAVRESVPDLPLSIKTRIGFSGIQTEEWIGFLLSLHPDALIIHGRTAKEMSKVPTHWEEIAQAVRLRNTISPATILLGNGDVKSYQEVLDRVRQTGVDGVMIGRGILQNMWVFDRTGKKATTDKSVLLSLLKKHLALYESTWHGQKPFAVMKKFIKIYVNGFDGASELRAKFMECQSIPEARALLQTLL